MQSSLKYILKSYFDDYVEGLDRNIDTSQFPIIVSNLKIKDHKIREEMEDSAFQFTDGHIGRVQMQMSWGGHVEIIADNIVLNFSFYPMKAMKRALMPWKKDEDEEDAKEDREDDEENQVPLEIQRRLSAKQLAQGQSQQNLQPQKPVPPRFCAAHGSSEKRPKVEPRAFQCETCHMTLQTNYAEARLCPPCSEKEGRCMCCGAPAPAVGAVPPGDPAAGRAPPNGVAGREATPALPPPPGGAAQMLQQQPVFCARHGKSELRPKVDPQERECRSCQVKLQTNYAEFTVCPGCSRRDSRCLICGAPADLPPPASAAQAVADVELEHERSLPPPPPPLEDLRSRPPQQRQPGAPPLSQQGQRRPPPGQGSSGQRSVPTPGAPLRPDTGKRPLTPPRGMRQLPTDPYDRPPDRPPEARDWVPPMPPAPGASQGPQRNSWSGPGGGPPPGGATPQWGPRPNGRRQALEPDRW